MDGSLRFNHSMPGDALLEANLLALIKPSLLKISSFAKGTDAILHHLKYISREGRLPLEDETGAQITSFAHCKRRVAEWMGNPLEKTRARDTMHLLLSPTGIACTTTFTQVVRDFLAAEFHANHYRYLFVIHLDTKQLHSHVVVKMLATSNERLIPDRSYLQTLKYHLAQHCQGLID